MKKYFVAALLAGGALAGPIGAAQVPERNLSWTHERSDLKPDPAARFGKLANGMRYVIYKNATPPGQVSMRLRFDVGDMMEADDQNGLAHFLEHMAFNGTKNIKDGEILKMLERHGLSFGREINAFTGPDQTAYLLDIPAATEAKLDTAFLFFRELAGEMTLDEKAIDEERGIIISEDRSMYTAARKANVAKLGFLAKGQIISKRLDIGNLDVIRTAKRERFADLYQRYYRPERAVMVIAGDVDPDKMESEIKRRFSDWKGSGEAGADPDYGSPAQRGLEVGSTVLDGAIADVSINWVRPYREEPDMEARRLRDLRTSLAYAVLNRRLTRLIEAGSAPFTNAYSGGGKFYRSLETASVSALPAPGREAEALAVLEQEARRILEHGILQSELDREIVERRSALQAQVAAGQTRPTPMLANELLGAASSDSVVLSPAQRLALFEAAVKDLTAAMAHSELKSDFSGSGPLLYAISPKPIAGGEAALAAAFQKSKLAAVTPPVAVAAKAWPYQNFGSPGRVAERKEIADLGVTHVRFENGVTLLVKPTKFQTDQVIVTARAAGGTLARPRTSDSGALQTLVQGGFIAGGLEGLTEDEMKQALSGKRYGASFAPSENAFNLRGETTRKDFATQMQVLAAYLSKPAWRPEAFERKKAEFLNIYSILSSSPMNLASTRYPTLVRSGDTRFGLPPIEAVRNATLASGRAEVEASLKNAPLEVLIVGDVTVDEAIAQTAATFGALPNRSSKAPVAAGGDKISFKASPVPQRIEHSGRPDVALGLVVWPTDDFHDDPAEARAQSVLRSVLQIRAIERIREQLGASYSPQTMQESSETFDEFGLLGIMAEVNPTEVERLFQTIDAVAEDLKAKPLAQEDLARALRPMIDQLEKDKATNSFWAARLTSASWDPRRLETIRTQKAHLEKMTPLDIQRLAQKYLNGQRAFRLRVEPGANASSSAPATKVIQRPQ